MISKEMLASTLGLVIEAAKNKSPKLNHLLGNYKAEHIIELNYLVAVGELSKKVLDLLEDN